MSAESKKTFAGLVIGLLLGLALGFSMNRYFCPVRDGYRNPERRMERFISELDLNAGQESRVRSVLEAKRAEMRELRREMKPRMDALREETRLKIRQELTPEQQKKFDVIEAERAKRRAEREKRRQH